MKRKWNERETNVKRKVNERETKAKRHETKRNNTQQRETKRKDTSRNDTKRYETTFIWNIEDFIELAGRHKFKDLQKLKIFKMLKSFFKISRSTKFKDFSLQFEDLHNLKISFKQVKIRISWKFEDIFKI